MTILTAHAERRCRQRGINSNRLETLLEHADIEVPVGGSCFALKVSRRAARSIRGFDGIANICAIISNTGDLRTILQVRTGPRGRRYRKGR
jgi:hypothetical protein